MSFLFITSYYKPAFAYGGPVRSISALCEGLVQKGARVTVYTTNANGPGQALDVPTNRPVSVEGVPVHYFPQAGLSRLIPFYSPLLGQACRETIDQFDAVYFYATWTHPMLAGARAAQRANVPYVVSPRGAFMTHSLQEKRLKKWLYFSLIEQPVVNRAAAIHCTSPMEQEQLQALKLQPPSVLIPNGLDLIPFTSVPEAGQFRRSLGLSDQSRLTIFVGRIAPEKRLELTVEAFARVARQLPQAHLALIGPESGSGAAVQQAARSLNLDNRLHYVGPLTGSELRQAYADADVLVLLSRRENFGMVALEAMAAGVPVLLSNEVGLAEQVSRAGAGLVVSGRPDDIVRAWLQLLTQVDGKMMGARGRRLVQQRFSQEVVTAQMLELLRGVATQRKEKILINSLSLAGRN